jgi:predicted nucleic acid binding AN1-type Zn finger protein
MKCECNMLRCGDYFECQKCGRRIFKRRKVNLINNNFRKKNKCLETEDSEFNFKASTEDSEFNFKASTEEITTEHEEFEVKTKSATRRKPKTKNDPKTNAEPKKGTIIKRRSKIKVGSEIKTAPKIEIEVKAEPKIEIEVKAKDLIQKNINRCYECNKKIGISGGIQCRCKYYFCGLHRYPNEHRCTINYMLMERKILTEKNIKISSKKVDKI